MPTQWTAALAQQAKAAVSPLRQLKTPKAYELKRQALELQRDMLQRAMDAEQLANPDGCDAPIPEGTDSHVRYMWAATQLEHVEANLRVVDNKQTERKATDPAQATRSVS